MDKTYAEIEHEFGIPDSLSETRVPPGSFWGLQPAVRHKVREGEPVLHCQYYGEELDTSYFFASVDGSWRLTAKASVPAGLWRD